MPRNRIIYNVQDIFIGSFPDETDHAITGCLGKQVLQRINGVQGFNYDFNPSLNKKTILGKTSYVSASRTEPSEIGVNFDYISNGANNEYRMGLNVNTETVANYLAKKNIAHDIALSDGVSGRNIYLVINDKEEDLHKTRNSIYPEALLSGIGFTEEDIIDPNCSGYSVLIFQNCHLKDYTSTFGIGKVASTKVSFSSDNAIGYGPGFWLAHNVIYTSSFGPAVDDVDNWTGTSMSAFQTSTIVGNDRETLCAYANTTANYHRLYKDIGTVAGKKYKITAKILIRSGGDKIRGFQFRYANGTSGPIIHPTLDAWYDFYYEYTAADNGGYDGWIEFWMANSSTVDTTETFAWAGGAGDIDSLCVRDIVVTEIVDKDGINIPYLDLKKGEVTDTVASVYTSDWKEGTTWDSWDSFHGGGGGSVAGTYFNGRYCLRWRVDTNNIYHYLARTMNLTIGKKYRVSGTAYIPSTNPRMKAVMLHEGSTSDTPGGLVTIDTLDSWTSFEFDYTSLGNNGQLRFFGLESTTGPDYEFAGASSSPYDELYIDNIVVTEVKEFIIPSSFARESLCQEDKNLMIEPANVSVDIQKNDKVSMVYTSDFEVGTHPWTANGAVSPTPGRSNLDGYWSMAFDGAGAGSHWLALVDTTTPYYDGKLEPNKKYKLTFKIKIPSTATNIDEIKIFDYYQPPGGGGNANTLGTITTKGSWVSFEKEFIAHEHTDHLEMRAMSDGSSSWTATASDEFFVRDVVITEFIDNGINFHNDHVQGASISFTLSRQKVGYVGHKMYGSQPIQLPIEAKLELEMLVKDSVTGSFLDNTEQGEKYNVFISCKDTEKVPVINYTFSGAMLESINSSSTIGQNSIATLGFTTSMNLDFPNNPSDGLFVSGVLDTVCATILASGGENLETEDGLKIIRGTAFYPKY